MTRTNTVLLLTVKLVVVGLLIAWLYSRSEADMHAERSQVVAARGTLALAADGATTTVRLGPEQAARLYDLARQSTWAFGATDAPRATFEILYDDGVADRVEVTGADRVAVNGSARRVDADALQAALLSARQQGGESAPAPESASPASPRAATGPG